MHAVVAGSDVREILVVLAGSAQFVERGIDEAEGVTGHLVGDGLQTGPERRARARATGKAPLTLKVDGEAGIGIGGSGHVGDAAPMIQLALVGGGQQLLVARLRREDAEAAATVAPRRLLIGSSVVGDGSAATAGDPRTVGGEAGRRGWRKSGGLQVVVVGRAVVAGGAEEGHALLSGRLLIKAVPLLEFLLARRVIQRHLRCAPAL